jgi:PAS domain S-box-containing protein
MNNKNEKPLELLLVEDNPGDVRLTREGLIDSQVHSTLNVAVDGEDAMAYLRKQGKYASAMTPDLILLDLNLPIKSGLEVLQEIKSDPHLQLIPVMVLTSSGTEKDILASYSLHADAFVTKPADLAEFTRVIAQIKRNTIESLEDNEQQFRVFVNAAPVMMWMTDANDRPQLFNDGWLHFTGQALVQALNRQLASEEVHPDDRAEYIETLERNFRKREPFEHRYRMKTWQGAYRWINAAVMPRFAPDGLFCGFIGCCTDITGHKQREDQIAAALKEKETMLAEIHHRVKNNLQIIDSLLGLQLAQVDDPATLAILRDSQNRVKSMALIHQSLYQSNDFSRVDFTEVCGTLISNLFASYGVDTARVRLVQSTETVLLPMNIAIPLGLLVNELISNVLKYAYPGGSSGEIRVLLGTQVNGDLELIVSDDGVGIAEDPDIKNSPTLGLQLVHVLSEQLFASLAISRQHPTTFTLTVPASNTVNADPSIEASMVEQPNQ